MKKSILTLLGVGLLLTSCQSDEPFAPVEGGEKQVTFTLNVPGELGTRASEAYNSADGGASNVGTDNIKYTLVLEANGDRQVLDNDDATINGKNATFSPTVVLGRKYKIMAYASLGNAWDGENAIDITKHFNDETKDAYHFMQENIIFDLNETNKQITLRRPFGKLRLVATDYVASGESLNTEIKSVKVTYTDCQAATFNATTGLFAFANDYVNATEADAFDGYYGQQTEGTTTLTTLFADYLPANPGDNMVDFTVEVTYTNDETYSRTFNDIPFKRNALTTLKGNFFTANSKITVKVDENFDNTKAENIKLVSVSTASQLQDAINSATPGETTEIILGNDIELTGSLVFGDNSGSPAPTRSGAAKSFVLDLNGKTINAPLKSEGRHHYAIDNYATLVIEGEGAINARGIQNFGEMTINGDITITNVDTNGGSAIWNEGELVINGGTFKTNNQAGEGSYGSALNTQVGGKAVVNGGTFEAYSQLTYAICNYGETVINDATVKGKHGAVASSTGCITEINGGSFSLMENPGVSDHCVYYVSSIKGGSFTLGNNTDSGAKVFCESTIADGYKAVKNQQGDKYYVVLTTDADADVAVTTATDLNAALAEGSQVIFVNDIAVAKSDAGCIGYGASGISQLNGGVIDGNGNDLSVNAWGTWDSALNTTGGTIKNLNVTGGMRGIFVNHNSTNNSKVILENVVIDGTVYTISCDQGTNQGLEATNSTFNGWTSYATTIGNVKFTNCSFGEGQGYAFCRPYASTTFVGCNFAAGYEIDARATVTFENCTINGVALTEANLATLVTSNTANATVK